MSTLKSGGADERHGGYHHGNLREALLEQGLALLEEDGGQDFSLRELARRVGVSANATYRHFSGKEDLTRAMAAEGIRRFAAAQQHSWESAEGSAADKFLATGCAYVHFACSSPSLFRLMFGRFVADHRSEEFNRASEQAFSALRLGVSAALGLDPTSEQATLAAYNAWAVVHGFSYLILDGQLRSDDQDVEALVAQALRGWLNSAVADSN